MLPTILWILSFIIILIIIHGLFFNQSEHFDQHNVENYEKYKQSKQREDSKRYNLMGTNPFLVGYDEDLQPIYRFIDYNTNHPIFNYKDLNATRFETRSPGLIKHRYAYNDVPETTTQDKDTKLYNFSFLKQLPQEICNRHYATVTKELSDSDPLLYYPDITNKKYQCQGHEQKKYPYANSRGDPVVVDVNSDLFITKKPIKGYDYDRMFDITANSGDGTGEFYSEINKLNADM